MIRLVFITDKARVIGASTEEGNARWFKLLPKDMGQAMDELIDSDNIAGGVYSANMLKKARKNKYILTRDQNFMVPDGLENVILIKDYMELVRRYNNSEDELLIVGGFTVYKLFLPYANYLDIAESNELVPGDLILEEWNNAEFQLISSKVWEGFRTLHYERILQTDRF